MKYYKGFKYQIIDRTVWQTNINPPKDIITPFVILRRNGQLELLRGFAWDGTSGPVIDRKTNMFASAVHDALYRLMRKGYLAHHYWPLADLEFKKCLEISGAWRVTVWVDLIGLQIANGAKAHPSNRQKIYYTDGFV